MSSRALPLLDDMQVASPCSASWDDMVGDERVRFCGSCKKNVYNVSAMPRDEAEIFLGAAAGQACVRFYRRGDGTVLTADCPVGITRRRRRRVAFGVVGGAVLAAAAVVSAREARPGTGEWTTGSPPVVTMPTGPATTGAIAVEPTVPATPVLQAPTRDPEPIAAPPPKVRPHPVLMGKPEWKMGTAPPTVRGPLEIQRSVNER
jgi:hypothetical protein